MWTIFFFMTQVAFKAGALQVTGHGDTSADFQGDAHFHCQLDDPKDVLQVTWQRLHRDRSVENVATYSTRFGEQVNAPYRDKIVLTGASLRSSSIAVRNLTWADEACYVCSFNAYPGGSRRHQTCLQVQGVSGVRTQVHAPPEAREVIFSCSATGKPTPKIQWDYPKLVPVVEDSQTAVVTHDDLSVTSSRNVTLRLIPDWDAQVLCLINPGMRGERRESMSYDAGMKEESEGSTSPTAIVLCLVILLVLVVVFIVVYLLKRFNHRLTSNAL